MIILGIDPGTAKMGFGVIKSNKEKDILKSLDYGCIETSPSLSQGERLKKLNKELCKIIKKYKPEVMIVERIFFFKNSKTAMAVSEAKGVILLTAAQEKIPVYEFTPLQVKVAVTGYGRAEKKQVQKMIKLLMNLEEIPEPDDAADALAIAICYINSINIR